MAGNVTASLYSSNEFVSIEANAKDFGNIEVGGQGNNTFDIIINEDAPLGTVINMELDIYLDGELVARISILVIGQSACSHNHKDSDINLF